MTNTKQLAEQGMFESDKYLCKHLTEIFIDDDEELYQQTMDIFSASREIAQAPLITEIKRLQKELSDFKENTISTEDYFGWQNRIAQLEKENQELKEKINLISDEYFELMFNIESVRTLDKFSMIQEFCGKKLKSLRESDGIMGLPSAERRKNIQPSDRINDKK